VLKSLAPKDKRSDKVFCEEERSMKEITRRLYTKPVMLGMAFLVGAALVVGLFVTSKSKAAPNSFPVAAGNDEFETAGDGQTHHNFSGSCVPAGFFGTGSAPFCGDVALQGVPLAPGSDVDTVINRSQAVQFAGGSTPIQMTGLSLQSISPITVSYPNTTESWTVQVGLSDYKASTGTMTINFSSFDSTLKVWPKFTFTRIPDGLTKVLDTGNSGLMAQTAGSTRLSAAAVPAATIAPAPCKVDAANVNDFQASSNTALAAAATSTCAPVTLSSVNSPWGPCAPGTFCITVPITEEERWAKHRPGPKGSIKAGGVGVAE
jgi:hypothetical protein